MSMDVNKITIDTYNVIAPKYCSKTRIQKILEWEESFIQRLLLLLSAYNPLILDIGCGDGRHCSLITKNSGRAIGIDLSDGMLKEAQNLFPEGNFQRMDMRNLSFPDNYFDGMWSSGSIYHIPKKDIDSAISEFRRTLKPDGIFALNFKLGNGEGLEANPKSYSGHPRYFAYYSKSEMSGLFESFGFEEIESCEFPEEIFGDNVQQIWFKLVEK